MKHALALVLALALPSFASAAPFAVLDASNKVVNVIEGNPQDAGFTAAFPGVVPLTSPGGIGSTYDPSGKTFTTPASTPTGDRFISAEQFLIRLTPQERTAIRASTDPIVVDFLYILDHTPDVNLSDPLTAQGLQYMESVGLLASGRAAQILQ